MYKFVSKNLMNRESRRDECSTRNTHGIEPNVFRDPDDLDERGSLVKQKLMLQEKLSLLNRQIKLAKRRHTFNEQGQVSLKTVDRWEAEKSNLASSITAIDKRLTDYKMEARANRLVEEQTFAAAFHEVAKEMLAHPVYERLVLAAVHRLGGA